MSTYVEPVERLGFGATRNLIAITFTVVPKSHLIEVMQAQRAGYAVDELGLGYRSWDDVGDVEF